MVITGYKIVYDVGDGEMTLGEIQAFDLPDYVRKTIDQYFDSIEEEENEDEDEENVLTEKEIEKLNKRLSDIEIEQRQAWGLHRISGGFVNAEFDYVEDDKIYITLTDGVQSDCQNTTNVTHVSLWRNNLEWTDWKELYNIGRIVEKKRKDK